MVSSKIERAKYGPGIVEVFFGVLLSLLLGALVALVYLGVQPVQIGVPEPKTEPVGPVVYIKGSQDADHGKQWLRKKQLFTEGTSVEVNEDELNAWITAGMTPETPKDADAKKPAPAAPAAAPAGQMAPGAKATPATKAAPVAKAAPAPAAAPATPAAPADPAAPAESGPVFQCGIPNFRIANGLMQIGVEGELNLDMLGIKRPIVLQVSGHITKVEGKFTFVPVQFYVGSCPLHKLPGVAVFVFNHVLAKENVPGDIAAAWKKLSDVSIDGNVLTLTMP
jgi:hypothetical protein